MPVAEVPQRVEEDPARRASVPRATGSAPRWGPTTAVVSRDRPRSPKSSSTRCGTSSTSAPRTRFAHSIRAVMVMVMVMVMVRGTRIFRWEVRNRLDVLGGRRKPLVLGSNEDQEPVLADVEKLCATYQNALSI